MSSNNERNASRTSPVHSGAYKAVLLGFTSCTQSGMVATFGSWSLFSEAVLNFYNASFSVTLNMKTLKIKSFSDTNLKGELVSMFLFDIPIFTIACWIELRGLFYQKR